MHIVDGREVNIFAVPAKRRVHHAQVQPRLVDAVDRVRYAADGRTRPGRDVVEVPATRAVVLR